MMKKLFFTLLASALAVSVQAQGFADFSKLNFGCDGNSITAGN